jgi:hypothetical protein
MAPIEYEDITYSNETTFAKTKWAKMFGVARDTFSAAAKRGGAKQIETPSSHPRQLPRQHYRVEDFPKIIKGFQQTKTPKNQSHPHPWSLATKVDKDNFHVTPKSGKKIIWTTPRAKK